MIMNSSHHISPPIAKGHSIETGLMKVLADMIAALDSGNFALLALLNLSAAFDMVVHPRDIIRHHGQLSYIDEVLNT